MVIMSVKVIMLSIMTLTMMSMMLKVDAEYEGDCDGVDSHLEVHVRDA